MKNRIRELDFFRGACAIVVFLAHLHLWTTFSIQNRLELFIHESFDGFDRAYRFLSWNTGGMHPSVIGFFVLSGVCIALANPTSPNLEIRFSSFLGKRFRRIMPVYWFASILGIIFCLLELNSPSGTGLLSFHSTISFSDLFLRGSTLSSLIPSEVTAGNMTLGTVASEVFLYVTFPVFCMLGLRRFPVCFLISLCLLQVALVRLTPVEYISWAYTSPMMHALFFYVGVLCVDLRIGLRTSPVFILVVSALLFLGFIMAREFLHFRHLSLVLQFFWALFCAGTIFSLINYTRATPSWMVPICSCVTKVGEYSYSLYAVHTPVIMITTWLLVYVGVRNYACYISISLLFTSILTYVSYRLLEKPYLSRSTEPNQALQRMNMLVTDHAPSSMLRAKHVHR